MSRSYSQRNPLPGTRPGNPRTTPPLRIASWNLRALGSEPRDAQWRFKAVAHVLAHTLKAPHIIAVQEMAGDHGAASAEQNAHLLIDALYTATGNRYGYCDCPPEPNADGGPPGSQIRNGFFYRLDRVELVPPVASADPSPLRAASCHVADGAWALRDHNPARIDPDDRIYRGNRKPLVAQFRDRQTQENYAIVNLHLAAETASRESESSAFYQPKSRHSGSMEQWRRNQVAPVVTFLDRLGEDSYAAHIPAPHILVLGDFNSHFPPLKARTDDDLTPLPLVALENAGLMLASDWLPAQSFSSASQSMGKSSLDHCFISRNLRTRLARIEQPAITSTRKGISDHNPLLLTVSPTALAQEKWVFSLPGGHAAANAR